MYYKLTLRLLARLAPSICFMALCSQVAHGDDAADPNALMPSRAGYTTTSLDPSGTSLPASYQGIDPSVTFINLVHKFETAKGEFETTQQYNDRLAKANKTPVIGDLMVDEDYEFKIDPSCVRTVYDADKKEMTVKLTFVYSKAVFSWGDPDNNTLLLQQTETGKQVYTATNGFGAEFQVAKATDNDVSLSVLNMKDFHFKMGFADDVVGDTTGFIVPMDVDAAKSAKANIAVLAICHLAQKDGHYIASHHENTTPTTSSPFDLDITDAYINAKLDQVWVYDSATGQVYCRAEPRSKK